MLDFKNLTSKFNSRQTAEIRLLMTELTYMSQKLTLKDELHALIDRYGEVEVAERYKSIYEGFSHRTYEPTVTILEKHLERLKQVSHEDSQFAYSKQQVSLNSLREIQVN